MLLADPTVDTVALKGLLAAQFGVVAGALEFVPVGGDSWCYRADSLWVSVRRERQGHNPASYEAASELADAGCDNILAPVRSRSGAVVVDLLGRPVVVFPYVEHKVVQTDNPGALLKVIGALHASTVDTPIGVESYDLFFDAELDGALSRAALPGTAASAGPYGTRLAGLLRCYSSRIAMWRAELAACQELCRGHGTDGFVITHGEPDGNVAKTADGRLLLLDCGDLRWGPPERDLLRLLGRHPAVAGRPEVFRFYVLRWILGEVAEYAARFTNPHSGDAGDDDKWRELQLHLPELSGPPAAT